MFKLCPQDVGIILTYHCPSGCAHCVYNCGPGWPVDPMPVDGLKQALQAVTVWPARPQVHFTGGEAFTHLPLLLEAVRLAASMDIPRYAETSAAWCTSEALARERFEQLAGAGLQAVLISCSPFHAERIPPARTLAAIRAALDVFGQGRVMVYVSSFWETLARWGLERPTPLARYEEELGVQEAGRLLWEGYGLIAGGRSGYRLGHLSPHGLRPPQAFQGENCGWELLYAEHSHMDLEGNFIPSFCGGLSAGSWRNLPQLLADYQAGRYPRLVELLAAGGPWALYEMAREEYGYPVLPAGYAGKCHLCVDVRRWLNDHDAHGAYAELRPRGFYDNI